MDGDWTKDDPTSPRDVVRPGRARHIFSVVVRPGRARHTKVVRPGRAGHTETGRDVLGLGPIRDMICLCYDAFHESM